MSNEPAPKSLVLGSSSEYRKLLLGRLGIPFSCHSPQIDETAAPDESPARLVARLAKLKAKTVTGTYPHAVVIGSDQVAVLDERVIGKPGTHDIALEQLESCSGKMVEFLTSVSVQCLTRGFSEQHTDRTKVHFRKLLPIDIERYLLKEKPYNCVGAFKAESLGIVLFERIVSEDPTAIIGLPLIRTATMLRNAGLRLP